MGTGNLLQLREELSGRGDDCIDYTSQQHRTDLLEALQENQTQADWETDISQHLRQVRFHTSPLVSCIQS